MKNTLGILAALLMAAPFAARAESELSLVLQGGAVKYNQALAAGTDLGGEYGARLGLQPMPVLGFEVGYLGSQSNVRDTLRYNGGNTRLITNGGYADARLNLLTDAFTPYIFGGYGLTNFKVSDEVAGGSLHGRTVSTIPFGGGIETNAGAFKIGARFQYNYLITDRLFTSADQSGVATGHNTDFYGVSIDLGASFH